MVVPAPLVGVLRYPLFGLAGDVGDELDFAVLGRVVLLEADDDAPFGGVLGPRAEDDDAGAHGVHLLQEAQVQGRRPPEQLDGVPLGVLALVVDHREDAFCLEQVADEPPGLFGVVFGEVRVAAEVFEALAEGLVADGIGNQVDMLAVTAECAVQELEGTLVDADSCDGFPGLGAFGDGVLDDFFVLVDDAAGDAFEAGEAAVRIECVPVDAAEHVLRGDSLQRVPETAGVLFGVFPCQGEVVYDAPVGPFGVECLVYREDEGEQSGVESIRHPQECSESELIGNVLKLVHLFASGLGLQARASNLGPRTFVTLRRTPGCSARFRGRTHSA